MMRIMMVTMMMITITMMATMIIVMMIMAWIITFILVLMEPMASGRHVTCHTCIRFVSSLKQYN